MRSSEELLIAVLRSVFLKTPLTESEKLLISDNIEEIYTLSARHDISQIVTIALRENNLPVLTKFYQSEIKAIYRYEQQAHEIERILNIFNKNNIKYVLLKGTVLKSYYSPPYIRTCADIDILVEDEMSACDILSKNLDYTYKHDTTGHHNSLYTQSGVHIELHYNLAEENINFNPWEYVINKNGLSMFNDLFFFTYHILHMAKHFKSGGCGLRSIIDIWIMKNKMGIVFDYSMLCSMGLMNFAKYVTELTQNIFENKPYNDITLQMQHYIVNGGVYGTLRQSIAVERIKKSKIQYVLNRLFLPLDTLSNLMTWIKKLPRFLKWLLYIPLSLWRLLFIVISGRLKNAFKQIKINASIDNVEFKNMFDALDI